MAKKTTLDDIAKILDTHGKQIRDLGAIVEKGFAAAKDDIADLKHELKGDIARVQGQVNSIEAQLKRANVEIRLADLEEKVFGEARR